MGLFDIFKKKAQQAAQQAQNMAGMGQPPQQQMPQQGMPQQGMPQQGMPQQAAPAQPAYSGPTFQWDGDVYPMPPGGWETLSVEEWFYKLESVRDHVMRADEEPNLPAMADEDGDPLDPEEVVLITQYGFKTGGPNFERTRNGHRS